jgi:hypothetical protein
MRLADPLAGLSAVADLGFGLAAGESLRACTLGTGFARQLDLSDAEVRAVYYTALLQHLGCVGAIETFFREEVGYHRRSWR